MSFKKLNFSSISGINLASSIKFNNSNIILFGDQHFSLDGYCKNKDSVELLDLLKYIFKNTNKRIDFFTETNFRFTQRDIDNDLYFFVKTKINQFKTKTYMSIVEKYFQSIGCLTNLQQDKEYCKKIYPNIYFYPGDLRHSKLKEIKYYEVIRKKVYRKDYFSKDLHKIIKNINTASKLKKHIKENIDNRFINKYYSKLNNKNKKCIDKYISIFFKEDGNIVDYINPLSSKDYNEAVKKYLSYYNDQSKIKVYRDFYNTLNIIKDFYTNLQTVVMDVYILSHLLYLEQSNKSNNFILYGGSTHIKNYLYFFENICNVNVNDIEYGKAIKKRCIKVNKMISSINKLL